MHHLFGELRKLPCSYCVGCNGFKSTCLTRGQECGDLDPCDDMSPNIELIGPAILAYFEYLDATKT